MGWRIVGYHEAQIETEGGWWLGVAYAGFEMEPIPTVRCKRRPRAGNVTRGQVMTFVMPALDVLSHNRHTRALEPRSRPEGW